MKRIERRGIEPEDLIDARCVNYQGCVAAIVERTGAEFPGIEMGAEDDELVGLFAAANFGDDILGIHRAGNFVGQLEMHANFLARSNETSHSFGVFARDDGLRQFLEFARHRDIMAVEKQARASGHPENRGGTGIDGASDDLRRDLVFAEQVVPRSEKTLVNKDDRAFHSGACFGEASVVTGAYVDDVGSNSISGDCGSPADGDESDWKRLGRENFDARATFTPANRHREFLGMHFVHSSAAECFDGPADGAISCGGTGDAAADRVREVSQIGLERRGAESVLDHVRSKLGAALLNRAGAAAGGLRRRERSRLDGRDLGIGLGTRLGVDGPRRKIRGEEDSNHDDSHAESRLAENSEAQRHESLRRGRIP